MKQELDKTTVVCHICPERYDKNLRFCPQCGNKNLSHKSVVFYCQKCWTQYHSGVEICQKCGGRVGECSKSDKIKKILKIIFWYFVVLFGILGGTVALGFLTSD
jgi:rRNA maturation endonuclease Nob1